MFKRWSALGVAAAAALAAWSVAMPVTFAHGGGAFELTGFSYKAPTMTQLDLTVTVTQTHPDGSDWAGNPSAKSETHAFPQDIYITLTNSITGQTVGTFPAGLTAGSGITYPKGGGSPNISATAEYVLNLPSTVGMGAYTLQIYSSHTARDPMTFRMGPYSDSSWFDDVVGGTSSFSLAYSCW